MNAALKHAEECSCERCYERLGLIVWTTRLFWSLPLDELRARVRMLEDTTAPMEDRELVAAGAPHKANPWSLWSLTRRRVSNTLPLK